MSQNISGKIKQQMMKQTVFFFFVIFLCFLKRLVNSYIELTDKNVVFVYCIQKRDKTNYSFVFMELRIF